MHVWSPPMEGTLNANWDAASNVKGGKVGMGVVIQNHDGEFQAAKSNFINGRFDPTVAEAMAAVHAIGFCKKLGVQSFELGGGCKKCGKCINF
jgi:ribonuclease HI